MSGALDYLVISEEELELRYCDWLGDLDGEAWYSYDQWKEMFYRTYRVYDNLKRDYIRDDSGNIKIITTLKRDYKSFNRNPFFIAQEV